jgi:hypothetical protein
MTGAAILSWEDFREAHRRVEIQHRLHDRFDRWLNQLEDRVKESTPSLEELTQAVFALRQEWTQAVPEGLGEQAHRAALEQRTAVGPWPPGPHRRDAGGGDPTAAPVL